MQPVVYDVAVSMDGFISGASGDVSLFPSSGPVVDDYMERLASYSCCLMGRKTYEFGYRYGLCAGDNPYPHMKSVVISQNLKLPSHSQVEVLDSAIVERITELRRTSLGPIYLCGGGQLAGFLVSHHLINTLRVKRAPILLGSGTRLFGDWGLTIGLQPVWSKQYDNGIALSEFNIVPHGGSDENRGGAIP